MRTHSILAVSMLLVPACALERAVDDDPAAPAEQAASTSSVAAEVAPFLGTSAQLVFGKLPVAGQASAAPWASSYWPVYQDNINYRWNGPKSESPSNKYGRAYGVAGVADAVSKEAGIDARSDAPACKDDSECTGGARCGKREGRETGRCIPSWWGTCHGSSGAALTLPEPKHSVVVNGVTFEVNDIKALASLAFVPTKGTFVATGCNEEVKQSSAGLSGETCKQVNAGTFHVLLTNYLGIRKQGFVEDRTFDDEVWNQPVEGYKVEATRAVLPGEALKTGVTVPGAASYRYVRTAVALASPTRTDVYEYVLALDLGGRVVGGHWVGASKTLRPRFVWVPRGHSETVAGGTIEVQKVEALVRAAAK